MQTFEDELRLATNVTQLVFCDLPLGTAYVIWGLAAVGERSLSRTREHDPPSQPPGVDDVQSFHHHLQRECGVGCDTGREI